MSIFTPINQVKLTNVSIVRMKKGGKRFEVACYKNKVLDYRNKILSDLDEVLQTSTIFVNVSKGHIASKEDLKAAFPNLQNDSDIAKEIVLKGDLQVGDKERAGQIDQILKDIVQIITDKTMNSETRRPFTANAIEKALNDLHFSVSTQKGAKQQALEAIKGIQEKKILPIMRAQMRIKIEINGQSDARKLKDSLKEMFEIIENEEWECDTFMMIGLISPGMLRPISEKVSATTKGKGIVTTLSLKEVCDEETLL